MPIIEVKTHIVGLLLDADVWLENQKINLGNDGGKNWYSTDLIDVKDGKLNIVFHGRGVPDTAWSFTITQQKPKSKDLFENKGSIRSNGHSLFADFVEIPQEEE